MQGDKITNGWGVVSQARTFFASWVKDAYFWMASWMVEASLTLNKVRRTIGIVGEGQGR
jgi:hypothetical protein